MHSCSGGDSLLLPVSGLILCGRTSGQPIPMRIFPVPSDCFFWEHIHVDFIFLDYVDHAPIAPPSRIPATARPSVQTLKKQAITGRSAYLYPDVEWSRDSNCEAVEVAWYQIDPNTARCLSAAVRCDDPFWTQWIIQIMQSSWKLLWKHSWRSLLKCPMNNKSKYSSGFHVATICLLWENGLIQNYIALTHDTHQICLDRVRANSNIWGQFWHRKSAIPRGRACVSFLKRVITYFYCTDQLGTWIVSRRPGYLKALILPSLRFR